tara:strand:+ start:406 stop:864 length:459 start_codon:yes stop_codon:yes gene_type:complete
MRTKLLIILIVIGFTSCHPLFCTWELGYKQLTTEPDQTELIGKYELTNSSKEFLIERKFNADEYILTLSKDGQYKFTNGPDLIFNNWGESNQKLIAKKGQWFVSCTESYDCLIELEGVCVVPLSQKGGKLAILITVGDGDECNGILYKKKKE